MRNEARRALRRFSTSRARAVISSRLSRAALSTHRALTEPVKFSTGILIVNLLVRERKGEREREGEKDAEGRRRQEYVVSTCTNIVIKHVYECAGARSICVTAHRCIIVLPMIVFAYGFSTNL